jgi:hypothetical protein
VQRTMLTSLQRLIFAVLVLVAAVVAQQQQQLALQAVQHAALDTCTSSLETGKHYTFQTIQLYCCYTVLLIISLRFNQTALLHSVEKVEKQLAACRGAAVTAPCQSSSCLQAQYYRLSPCRCTN